jgi:low temperature requirement protein LtrA
MAMIFLWIRAAKYDRSRRRSLFANAAIVFIAQILWICLIFWKPPLREALLVLTALGCVEFVGPFTFYRSWGAPPWHAHHIAERYSLLVIIALGECVSGAVAMVGAVVNLQGWSLEPILIGTACIGLAFGCWWLYFLRPFGGFLKDRRERAYGWGYLHVLVFSSIVAMGSGLQLSGGLLEGRSQLSLGTTLMFTAISVCAYVSSVFAVNNFSLFPRAWIDFLLWCGSVLMTFTSLVVMKLGGSLPLCLGVLASAPFVVVVGYEAIDHKKSV